MNPCPPHRAPLHLPALLVATLALVATSCAPDLRPDLPPPGDATAPASSENGLPSVPDLSSDALPTDNRPLGFPCTLQQHCAEDLVCAAERCQEAPTCRRIEQWRSCVRPLDELEAGLGERGACLDQRCRVVCQTDAHCLPGNSCTDFGQCRPFDGTLEPWTPTRGERTRVHTGYGETLIDYPIGVPLGGYGERSSGLVGRDRYASALRSSVGTMHAMTVRAAALDTGERQLLLVSIPVIFIGADMHEAVARALQEATGRDWRDDLIIAASHSHSGPARLWPLPDNTLIPLGILGIGDYSREIRDGMIRSLIDASLLALDDLEPGRFGWSIIEAFDTDDALARDRWGEIPPFDDNRLLIMRFDDEDGIPKAVTVSYGVHGTVNGDDFASNDVMTGVERALEEALGDTFDRVVPTFFVNQNSGSMSPANDGQPFPQAFERAGSIFVERFLDDVLAIETTDDLTLRSRTYRFPLTYEALGYAPGEFRARSTGDQFTYGALQCAATGYEDDPDFENVMDTDRLECLDVQLVFFNRSPTMFMTGQITAATLGDLTLLTMPGELTMPLGWAILQRLEQEEGVDPLQTWTIGYAQDHHLYLAPTRVGGDLPPFPGISTPRAPAEYPEFAFSWLRGGYHQTMTTWGWKYGDFMVDRALDAYRMLQDPDHTPAGGTALPRVLGERDEEPFPIDATPTDLAGTIVDEPPTTVARFEPIEVAWVGGDPGAEAPQTPLVTLEREEDGSFTPVQLRSRRTYTNREYRFMTRVRQNGDRWEWVARWEELRDFPAGTYRFRVEGHHATTANDRASRTPYEAVSRPFTLTPTDTLVLEGSRDGDTLSLTAHNPPYERLDLTRVFDRDTGFDDRAVSTGHFRLRHPHTRPGQLTPLPPEDLDTANPDTITVTDASGTPLDATVDITRTGDDVRGTSRIHITLAEPAPGAVTVTLTDRWENTARATF